jgi:di/tricarboxylate transporter
MYIYTGQSSDEEGEGKAMINLIDLAGCIVIWLVLYFFIFEMRIVKDKLQSDSPEEYKKKRQITLRSRLAVMIIVLVLMLIVFVLGAIYNISIDKIPDEDQPPPALWSCLLDFICRVLKIIVDIYLVISFIEMQTFFIKEKAEQLEEREK